MRYQLHTTRIRPAVPKPHLLSVFRGKPASKLFEATLPLVRLGVERFGAACALPAYVLPRESPAEHAENPVLLSDRQLRWKAYVRTIVMDTSMLL